MRRRVRQHDAQCPDMDGSCTIVQCVKHTGASKSLTSLETNIDIRGAQQSLSEQLVHSRFFPAALGGEILHPIRFLHSHVERLRSVIRLLISKKPENEGMTDLNELGAEYPLVKLTKATCCDRATPWVRTQERVLQTHIRKFCFLQACSDVDPGVLSPLRIVSDCQFLNEWSLSSCVESVHPPDRHMIRARGS